MQFSFHFNEDDYMAYQEYFLRKNKTFQKSLTRIRWILPVFILLVIVFFSLIYRRFLVVDSIIYVIISIVWFIIVPKLYFRSALLNMKKIMEKDKDNPIVIGDRTYQVDENEVRLITCASDTGVKWAYILEAGETADYIYMSIASTQAFVIPKKKVDSVCVNELRAMIEQKKGLKMGN